MVNRGSTEDGELWGLGLKVMQAEKISGLGMIRG